MSHSYAEIHKTKPRQPKTDEEKENATAVKPQYYFLIKSAGNNAVLATSEMYTTKGACKGGIAAVYTIKGNVYSDDQTIDKTGEK